MTFTDTSTGNPTSWQWIFGDGGTSTQRNPTHALYQIGDLYDHFDRSEFGGIEPDVALPASHLAVDPAYAVRLLHAESLPCDRHAQRQRAERGTCSGCQLPSHIPGGRVVRRSGRREDGIGESHRHERGGAGNLRVYPTDIGIPETWTISFRAGQTRGDNAMSTLATDGTGTIGVKNDATGTVHVIVDVNGYFESAAPAACRRSRRRRSGPLSPSELDRLRFDKIAL